MIDKVNIITHHVFNGKMRTYSPYQRYDKNEQFLDIGNKLPLPTNQEVNYTVDSDNLDINVINLLESIYLNNLEDNEIKDNIIKNLKILKINIYINQLLDRIPESARETIGKNFLFTVPQSELWGYINSELISIYNKALDLSDKDDSISNILTNLKNQLDDERRNFSNLEASLVIKQPRNLIKSVEQLQSLSKILHKNYANINVESDMSGKLLKELLDAHNLYFVNMNPVKQRESYENFISKRIWQISIDPRNWIQGQKSVDNTTDPWKILAKDSPQATESNRFIGSSVVGTLQQLILTLEGKQNVGIIANSLKTLEAISHNVYKTLLYGNTPQIRSLFFDLQIHGEQLHSIANAWVNSNRFNELDDDTQNILKVLDQYTDAFIELSSLLSLAVDNAKDPTLSKINGNTTMIGLYTTGLIMGLKKETLIEIINSNTGRIVSELMQGNIFTGRKGFQWFDEVIDYLNKLPSIHTTGIKGLKKIKNQDIELTAKTSELIKLLNDELAENENSKKKSAKTQEKIESIKNDITQLKRFKYYIGIIHDDSYKITDSNGDIIDQTYWKDLQILMRVNSELKQVNKGTKLNQGIANSIEEQLASIHDIQQIVNQMVNNKAYNDEHKDLINKFKDINNGSLTIDFKKFIIDEGYRESIINFVNEIKWVVNPYQVFWNVGHYRGYLEGLLTVLEGSKKISKIYASTISAYQTAIKQQSLTKDEKTIAIKQCEEYFHRKRNRLFFENLGNKFTFTYKSIKNNRNISYNGVTLTTPENRQAFKELVEFYILPRLQKQYSDNIFIQSLYRTSTNRTISRNLDTMISSHISTRLDDTLAIDQFKAAKQSLQELHSETINGTSIITILFAYNLIAVDNLNIRGSLSPFFEDMRLSDINSFIKAYDDFIINPKLFQDNQWINVEDSFYEPNIDNVELKKYCAPIRSYKTQDLKSSLVLCQDKKTKQYKFYQLMEDENKNKIRIELEQVTNNIDNNSIQINGSNYSFIANPVTIYKDRVIDNELTQLAQNASITNTNDLETFINNYLNSLDNNNTNHC